MQHAIITIVGPDEETRSKVVNDSAMSFAANLAWVAKRLNVEPMLYKSGEPGRTGIYISGGEEQYDFALILRRLIELLDDKVKLINDNH